MTRARILVGGMLLCGNVEREPWKAGGASDRDACPTLSKQGRGREKRLGGSMETTMQSEEHHQGCWGALYL